VAKNFLDFLIKEWLLIVSFLGVVFTSLYLGRFPKWEVKELVSIFLLFALFVVIKGIENSFFLLRAAYVLERGRYLSLKLVFVTFLLSMIVTIDVSLVTMMPVVLSLNVKNRENLAILVALTAHVGAALTPFGTPQNLFIYSYYGVDTYEFIKTIAPFSFLMLLFFSLVAVFMNKGEEKGKSVKKRVYKKKAAVYLLLLFMVVLAVLRVLPPASALFAIGYASIFDRKSLRVDYPLLFTFVMFIGLTSNIKEMISGFVHHPGHIFLLSSLMSQFISNVPTTLLLNKFTTDWQALLWGTNVGGFGSLIAALANLITYKLFISYGDKKRVASFTFKFVFAGYVSFAVGALIYFCLFVKDGGGSVCLSF